MEDYVWDMAAREYAVDDGIRNELAIREYVDSFDEACEPVPPMLGIFTKKRGRRQERAHRRDQWSPPQDSYPNGPGVIDFRPDAVSERDASEGMSSRRDGATVARYVGSVYQCQPGQNKAQLMYSIYSTQQPQQGDSNTSNQGDAGAYSPFPIDGGANFCPTQHQQHGMSSNQGGATHSPFPMDGDSTSPAIFSTFTHLPSNVNSGDYDTHSRFSTHLQDALGNRDDFLSYPGNMSSRNPTSHGHTRRGRNRVSAQHVSREEEEEEDEGGWGMPPNPFLDRN